MASSPTNAPAPDGGVADLKKAARRLATASRKAAKDAAGKDAAHVLADRVLDGPARAEGLIRAGSVVSGFLPIGSEINTLKALDRFREMGCTVCLPCVVQKDAPLVFRAWTPGDLLIEESFGTRAPADTAAVVEPDLLLVPMLAFDRQGYRLGYGGGFYDRSLDRLRGMKRVVAVGVAFAGQEVDAVPHDSLDQPLDWIVTEKEAIRLTRADQMPGTVR
ncbi:5-formyltetrahydrofolate cyclo-ligase [Rhodospirillaceae bacterium KN72]|uniref:5-formyltetrahydrofolate cyclo-ligase n=1 Tax=Pacificispira spongiicola TaxID=2729598 RepID=A0A7Y0DWM3_9PROT|nr:5-formyltetrahydrofolate cyclo-ligase [Pacificispira spongiicola]